MKPEVTCCKLGNGSKDVLLVWSCVYSFPSLLHFDVVVVVLLTLIFAPFTVSKPHMILIDVKATYDLIDVKPTGLQVLWCTGHKCKPWLSRHGGNSVSGSSVDRKVQIPCLERIHCILGFFFFFFEIQCWIILQNYAWTWKSTQQSQFM